jgi:aspartate/methionine/tyrosine aminotransferase
VSFAQLQKFFTGAKITPFLGWIVTKNQRVYDNMAAYKDYTSICNSGPSELLSIIALKQYSALVARNKQIIKENIAILNQFFSK